MPDVPLPKALGTYYGALDQGHFDVAASCFTEDVSYAVPLPDEIETQPRRVLRGRSTLERYFCERESAWPMHEVLVSIADGDVCLVEGRTLDRETARPVASFVAATQLAPDGAIARYVSYQCAPPIALSRPSATSTETATDASALLDRYFMLLDAGRFVEAAGCFSEDVVYSHPPYRHTGLDGDERITFRGRRALTAGFVGRGKRSFHHRLRSCVQRGPSCLLEGVVEDLPDGGTGGFISSLTISSSGLIDRYVSFYCEPAVP